jgi:hypothetical protein
MLHVINFIALIVVTAAIVYNYVVFTDAKSKLQETIDITQVQLKAGDLKNKKDFSQSMGELETAYKAGDTKNMTEFSKQLTDAQTTLKGDIAKTNTSLDQKITQNKTLLDNQFKTLSEQITTKSLTTDTANLKGITTINQADVLGGLNVSGDASLKKDLDLNGTLWFGKNDGSSDPYSLRKVKTAANSSSLRLTLNDDADEALEVWGNSCGADKCVGEGKKAHRFDTVGNASHEGTAKASRIQLGEKWTLSGAGNNMGNDDWLRIANTNGTDYYGGVATRKLFTQSEAHMNGVTNINGKLNVSRKVNIAEDNPGAMIEKRYGGQDANSWGLGQFNNGTMRMYGGTTYGPGTVNMSLARANGQFDDIVSVGTNGQTSIKNKLNVGGDLCLQDVCLTKAELLQLKQAKVV